MRRWFVFVVVIAAGCASALQVGGSADPGFPPGLAADLTEGLAGSWEEGFQVAVVLGDGATWTYQEEPGTSGVYFADIGSIGKTFEAALVLRLVEAGDIDLDDPVGQWIEAPAGVTVRHLLQHTSGIASDDRDLPPVCGPGTCQSYSNSGYEMVSELVEEVTDDDHEATLERLVLEPLGLTDATLDSELIEYSALGLARFAQGIYRGNLLRPSSLDEMLDFESALGLPGGNECETMGLGTVRRHVDSLGESWGHGGWTSVSRSWMEYFPESETSIAVIVNGGTDFLPLGPIYESLESHLPESSSKAPCDHNVGQLVRSDERLITERTGYDGQPALSPDGSTLAYLSVFDDGIDIMLHDLATGDEDRLAMDGWDVTPRWSPDGRLIYSNDSDGDREIHFMDAETGEETQLTDNDADDYLASFSPDGSRIVFVRGPFGAQEVWVMASDGNSQSRIDGSQDNVSWPAWSPDGSQVVYTSGGEPFIIDVAGGEPFRIPINQVRLVDNPSWAPGPDILFSADGDVWSVAPDGSELTRLTATSSAEDMPVWGDDGSIFYQVWHISEE